MTGPIGLFGLGLIGMVLARRLIAQGHAVIGHDPDPGRMALLAGAGGTPADAATVWARVKTVLIAVFDTDQVGTVLRGAPAGSGATAVVMTTCDPVALTALSGDLPRGLRLIEAPISGTSAELEAGEAIFLTGGAPEDLGRLAPLLGGLGRACHHAGALGDGTRAKLAINLILGLNRAALAEGLVFAERLGLDPARLLPVAQDSAAASAVMATKGPRMIEGNFAPQGRVRQSAKDFALILQSARDAGQGLPMAERYLALMHDCIAADEGEMDNAAIIAAIRRARPGAKSVSPDAPVV